MRSLSDSPNSDKSCEECPGEGWSMHRGWCMHQERERWARRLGNDSSVPAPAAVLNEHAARRRKGTVGDRWLGVAARLELQRVSWKLITHWTGIRRQALTARQRGPKWAEACTRERERVLKRRGATELADAIVVARDAALATVGMPTQVAWACVSVDLTADLSDTLGDDVPSELRADLALAAVSTRTAKGIARAIRRHQHEAELGPDSGRKRPRYAGPDRAPLPRERRLDNVPIAELGTAVQAVADDARIAAEATRRSLAAWDALERVATPPESSRLELLRLALLPDRLCRSLTVSQAKKLVASRQGVGVGAIDKMFSKLRMRRAG